MSMLPAGGKAYLQEAHYSLWAALRPAKSVGGDLYAVHCESQQRLFIAVGDVSDKGVPAAIFMARAMTLLQKYADSGLDAPTILARLNDDLVEGNDNCMFVTLFAGWLDLESLILSFASGGHTPPSLRRDQQCYSIELEDGPALGLMQGLEFPCNQLQLQQADLLAIYTDGVDEAFSEDNVQFGIDSFNRLLQEGTGTPLGELGAAAFSAVDRHAGNTPQSDDITVMLLQLPAKLDLQLAANGRAVASSTAWLADELSAQGIAAHTIGELQLVTEEVITNITKYGQLADDALINLSVSAGEAQLVLEFKDAGIAFNPIIEAPRAELGIDTGAAEIGGLGVHLVEALTDRQEYNRRDNLNCLRLYKQL
jgi:sigma-B regulation protein RsbU (phosphoserine phosphatase)